MFDLRALTLALSLLVAGPALAADAGAHTAAPVSAVGLLHPRGLAHPTLLPRARSAEGVPGGYQTGRTLFQVGAVGSLVGVGVVGVGVVIFIGGAVVALFAQDVEIFLAGALVGGVTAIVGVGIVGLSLPVMVTGSLVANKGLRNAGVQVTSVPGWLAVGSLGVVAGGLALSNATNVSGPIVVVGVAGTVAGGVTQAILNARAFKHYEAGTSGASASLAPGMVGRAPGLRLGVVL